MKIIGEFYKTLYDSVKIDQVDIDDVLNDIELDNVLSDTDKHFMDQMPSLEEFDEIVNIPKNNKSPGLDGLPVEFYRKFWPLIRDLYFSMICESWDKKILPLSTRTSVLSTLFKANNRKKLVNYRPLSLTNSDYRLIALLFAKRLEKVLYKIISSDQSSYIGGRYIGTSIRNIIDLYDFCESTNTAGAFLCADFLKAFDTLEHNFIFSVLEKFNFGNTFISWLSVLYSDVRFKVKNNGWVSEGYIMRRGLRQGCSMSALIFIIAVEILAYMIKKNKNIRGIRVGGNEHKLVQYADDTTVCVSDLESVGETLRIFKKFGNISGLKLNFSKTRGIWLGELKDLGYRVYRNVVFTGKPVKCLGIYIGHNVKLCQQLNWDKKVGKMEQCIDQWKKRKISLFGKVYVIKTFILSKIVYPASVLIIPDHVIPKIKNLIFRYLWGKRDRIKRSNVSKMVIHGGLNMTDIDSFFKSLKASWVSRFSSITGKWIDLLKFYVERKGLTIDYFMKTNVSVAKNSPLMHSLPQFYQDVFMAFNKCKSVKNLKHLNKHEIIALPIWGNSYFKVGNDCLYFKEWIRSGILYIKDLVGEDGTLMKDEDMYKKVLDKNNIIQQIYMIKNYVFKKIRSFDITIAPYVNIKRLTHITVKNNYVEIMKLKSKDFYGILSSKCQSHGNMESIYNRIFNIEGRDIWTNIYSQKVKHIHIPKVAEFNYKVLHNILPNGYILNKWNDKVSSKCEVCGDIETTEHMIYKCPRIQKMWKEISDVINVNVQWKNVVCGFPGCEMSTKINVLNHIVSIICYTVFKANSRCKFDDTSYENTCIYYELKKSFKYYAYVLHEDVSNMSIFNSVMQYLSNGI